MYKNQFKQSNPSAYVVIQNGHTFDTTAANTLFHKNMLGLPHNYMGTSTILGYIW